jgi:COP9 signalosome complex subunit 12
VAGRYLRLYAIRADEERQRSGDAAETSFQDDFDPEVEEHKHLEDCARQLNRIFNLCLSDR